MGHREKIRNVPAFLRSFMKSSSGQRALNRNPSFTEHTITDKKGTYTYRDNYKYNTIAHALAKAVGV